MLSLKIKKSEQFRKILEARGDGFLTYVWKSNLISSNDNDYII